MTHPNCNTQAQAILCTLAYADIFDYPLTASEVHRYLIGVSASLPEIQVQLHKLANGHKQIEQHGDWFVLPQRAENCTTRRARNVSSTRLWAHAQHWGAKVAKLPFVRMVAVTGALSMNNAPDNDDIDLFIITQTGRVWLARAMAVSLVRWARRSGIGLCPNYVLAASALAQTQRNLFIAHEIAQMIPLNGESIYKQLRLENAWTAHFLPNANDAPTTIPMINTPNNSLIKPAAEALLSGKLGDWLDHHEHQRKQRKFANYQRSNPLAAQLDHHHVKGHFNDHGTKIITNYELRITNF